MGTGTGRCLSLNPLRSEHWPEVSRIYAEGIATGNATFEAKVPSWDEWAAAHIADHCFVAEADGTIVGWIALASVSRRPCYSGVAEVTVYVAEKSRGQGIGSALLERLIASSKAAGIWTLQTSVFPENEPSLALLKRHGFREVGVRERIAQLNGVWRDTVLLERRST